MEFQTLVWSACTPIVASWRAKMPALKRNQVIDLLTRAVKQDLNADDLLQVHKELFLDNSLNQEEFYDDDARTAEILEYINGDLAVEDLIDLWNLIYPKHRHVWYDEQAEKFHYNEESSPLPAG